MVGEDGQHVQRVERELRRRRRTSAEAHQVLAHRPLGTEGAQHPFRLTLGMDRAGLGGLAGRERDRAIEQEQRALPGADIAVQREQRPIDVVAGRFLGKRQQQSLGVDVTFAANVFLDEQVLESHVVAIGLGGLFEPGDDFAAALELHQELHLHLIRLDAEWLPAQISVEMVEGVGGLPLLLAKLGKVELDAAVPCFGVRCSALLKAWIASW